MAPSPRKRAAALSATWTDNDATSFDPASLPVARLPRAWERKPHVTKRDGKEKKVWRTYATRSETSTKSAAAEEQDAQVRAVKRQLRVRPTDLEHMPGTPRSKKRAFKATRFDRRKSVLPRKNITSHASITPSAEYSVPASSEAQAPSQEEGHVDSVTSKEQPAPQELGMQEATDTGRRRSARLSGVSFARGKRDSLAGQLGHMPRSPAPKAFSPPRKPTSAPESAEIISTEDHNHADLHAPHQPESMDVAEDKGFNEGSIEEVESGNMAVLEANHQLDSTDNEAVAQELNLAPISEAKDEGDLEDDRGSESDDEPDTDLSRLSINSDEDSPEDNTIDSETESPNEAAEEDFTEASMQLDLLSELPSPSAAEYEAEFREHRETTPEDVVPSIEGPDESLGEEESTEPQDESDTSTEDSMDITAGLHSPVKQEPAAQNLEDVPEADAMDIHVEPEAVSPVSSLPHPITDITDGLTLTPTIVSRAPPAGRKLLFPSPPPPEPAADEPTGTVYLDDDTALLKDFLTRAAASKASRAEKAVTIARRTSFQNRRDSDVIRQALASPRKILEDKDPNSPSKPIEDVTLDVTLDLALTPVLTPVLTPDVPVQDPAETEIGEDEEMKDADKDAGGATKSSRRSTRARKSRLPAPGTPGAAPTKTGPNKISVRRTDAGEPIVLKKTEAQELGLITRNNTRKNKQGAVNVQLRLARLAVIAPKEKAKDDLTPTDGASDASIDGKGKRRIRWDTTLAYYQEDTRSLENALAEAQSLATPDELSADAGLVKPKQRRGGASRSQRARGLGATNGTPGKGLLAPAALLPDGVVEEKKSQALAPAPEEKPKKEEAKEKAKAKESTAATVTATPTPTSGTDDKKAAAPRLPAPKAGKPKKSMLVPPTPALALSSSPAVSKRSSSLGSTSSAPPSTQSSIRPPKPYDPKSGKARTTTPIPLPAPVTSVTAPFPFPKDRKSRLATPRRVKLPGLPVPATTAASATAAATGSLSNGKENRTLGLASGTPKKGFKVLVPAAAAAVPEGAAAGAGAGAVESGLPRRRGRKV